MTGADPRLTTADNYRRFASEEAHGRSPSYERLASQVAEDATVLAFLQSLPRRQRQPNLVFAAARTLLGTIPSIDTLRGLVRDRAGELRTATATRRTQTNEPGRCAVLLPALAQLPGPLALVEVGASAGLGLLVDRYSYDYAGTVVAGLDPAAPSLSCEPRGEIPLPRKVPEIVWRAGIDLSPLDVNDPADVDWLRCLVWPDQPEREQRLEAAIAAARRAPPPLHCGDLVDALENVAADAPSSATLVVFHSAVLAYVEPERRRRFVEVVGALGATWLSNEGPGVVAGTEDAMPGVFVLARDGRPLACSHPHGEWTEWIG